MKWSTQSQRKIESSIRKQRQMRMGCQRHHTDHMFPQTLCPQHPDHSPEACTLNHVFKNKLISSLTCSASSWLLGGAEDPRAIVYPSLPFTPCPSPGLLRSLPPHHLSHPSPLTPLHPYCQCPSSGLVISPGLSQ